MYKTCKKYKWHYSSHCNSTILLRGKLSKRGYSDTEIDPIITSICYSTWADRNEIPFKITANRNSEINKCHKI